MNAVFFIKAGHTTTETKLDSFKSLPNGWRYGKGVAPSEPVLDVAKHMLRYLYQLGLTRTEVFPGESGEVLINAYSRGHTIEVQVERDGRVSLLHEQGDQEISDIPRIASSEATTRLAQIAARICNTSGSYIPVSIVQNVDGSVAMLSNHQTTMVAYQSFSSTASTGWATQYANTQVTGTNLGSTQTTSFSGFLTQTPYRARAV